MRSSSPNRSSACFRSDSFSVLRRRALRSVSSSLGSLAASSCASSAAFRRSCLCSSIRCALLFLCAAASSSAFALAAAAAASFSRSASESSAASHESRTWVLLERVFCQFVLSLFFKGCFSIVSSFCLLHLPLRRRTCGEAARMLLGENPPPPRLYRR